LHKTVFLRNSVLIIILMLSIVLLSYNSTFQTVVVAKKHHINIISRSGNGQQQQLPPPPHLIQICCAWGDKLALGILTYQINGGDSAARHAVYNAIGNWNSKLMGLKLVESSGSNAIGGGSGGSIINAAQPDIEVSIVSKSLKVPGSTHHRVSSSSLGGNSRLMIGGLSQDSFDGNGFLTHVKITIPTNTLGMSFDLSNNIEQIAEHEMGHALGLGHANFVGDLMFPIANFQTGGISQCDVSAVLEANHLKMVGSDTSVSPQMPQVGYIDCR
jgi:Matrixin